MINILLGATIFMSPLQMKPFEVIHHDVAITGMTRFEVQDDPIKGFITLPLEAHQHFHIHPSGHLFFTGKGLKGTVHLSLITQSGAAQDMALKLKDIPSHPVILTAGGLDSGSTSTNSGTANTPKLENTVSRAKAVLSRLIRGFNIASLAPNPLHTPTVRSHPKLTMTFDKALCNKSFDVEVWRVEAPAGTPLDAATLRHPKDKALAFSERSVPESGTCKFFAIQQKGENNAL